MPHPGLPPLRLGTRGSALALWQAQWVATRLKDASGRACEIVTIKTSGDRLQTAPLSPAGGKRLFVKEIEDALLDGKVDLAVHSSKDLPAILPDGLEIGAALPREDPRDALVLGNSKPLAGPRLDEVRERLGATPRIGTMSVRRIAQLAAAFPGARFESVRGNLDTRLRKLDAGEYDALVLAAAGLKRLGLTTRISLALPTAVCVPAPGQGIVAVEVRSLDAATRSAVASIDDWMAASALTAERALVEALGGGCQMPLGALASPAEDGTSTTRSLELVAVVLSPRGDRMVQVTDHGPAADARALGARVAARLLAQGAGDILDMARDPG